LAAPAHWAESGDITFTGGTLQFTSNNTGNYATRIKGSTSAITLDTNGQTVIFTGAIASTNGAGLTKTGDGTLTLSNANAYAGVTTINAGTLRLDNTNALGGGGDITFTGGTLQFTSNNTGNYATRIKGSTSAIALDTNGQTVSFTSAIDFTKQRRPDEERRRHADAQ